MPTMPKKKANTINSSSSKSFGSTSMFKKSSSSSTLGTRTDTKLSQASLSSFFKARPPDTSAKEAPAIPASIIPTKPSTLHSTPIAKPAPTSVSLSALALLSERAVGAKAPRRIIIDDNDDEYLANSGSRAMSMLTTKPLKRFKAEKARVFTIQRTAAAISAVNDNALPFEDRMPVSPPDTSDPAAVQLSEQTENVDDLTNQKQIGPATQPIIIPDSSSQSGTTITTTPQKDITQRNSSVSQKSNEKSSPFRTPNEKSRRSSSTMESLGLSPQDSVFWVRTPPSEALKKLEAMSSGSSHEEEIASIVGRLYETSSAGAALRSMDKEPRDRIKDMLNTIRGSSIVLDPDLEDDLEDLERPDPKSPTKELVDRHKNMAAHRQGLVRHRSAHELGCAKERGGTTRPVSSSNLPFPAYMTSPSKRREDVLKMIEQINANIGEPSENGQDDSGGPSLSMRTLMGSRQSTGASTLFSGRRARVFDRPTASDSISGIPLQDRLPQPQSPPGEFDSFFTDLDMDDQDFAELTQLELSSTSMSSAGSNTTSVSCPSSSAGSCANRGFSHVHRELLDLDMESSASMINIRSTLQSSECAETTPLVNQARVASPRDDFDDLLDLGDDFDIEDDLGLSEFSSMPRKDSAKYRRFLVNEVSDGIIDSRWIGRCKVLEAQETKDSTHYRIFLRDSWSSSRIAPGNIVHVINALFFQLNTPELMVNDAQGFLIVRPDILIPTSVLAESFSCIRKPIVDIRTRKTDKTTVPLIHGTMLHELFQHSLQANNFSTAAMESCIDKIIKAHLNDLYLVNESIDIARDSISRLIPSCQDWARRYLRATPTSEGTFEDSIGVAISNRSDVLCVNKILDIEENIWSPMFGLKGKIDASIQVVVKTTKKTAGFEEIDMCTLTVPFELKTGRKSVIPHRAQTMLYTLLMTDRYDVDVRWGLLLYLKTGEFIRVPAPHDEIRTILMQRNEIAVFEEEMLTLPPMAKNAQKCERCFSFSSCSVLHKLLEDGNAESSGLGTRFDEVTDHLNGTHAAFLRHWNRLLTLEQGDVAMFQSQIWSMLSAERQAAGDCFSNLLLVEQLHSSEPRAKAVDDGVDDISLGRYGRYRYRFKIEAPLPSLSQQTLSQTLRGGNSLLSSNISVGDPIVVSSETQHYALAIGQVQDMSMSDVTVGLDRPLLGPPIRLDGYDQERNQSYRGLIDIVASSRSAASDFGSYHAYLQKFGTTFRIDKDEMAAGIARTRNNLVQLFRADADGGDSKRRRLVVDLERPIFEPVKVFQHNDLHLNDDQRHAIETVLTARDYALILGMPGTGKTTTIAQIIHTLVAQGKSVLLSSYTHSAVDNVLMKLRSDINVVRLGNKDRIHRDIRHLIPDFSQPPMNTVEAIHKFYGRCQVVGTTCLGIGDIIAPYSQRNALTTA
ncbi:DNA replication factor Dna2-domain-containing protein [Gamsiella multidivaricata]|uniref:DNA replication factor Dna2-domain-containing protein n=1 Tax=Gamsiella multidivaricata TaxID=101098 RepID=UPI002220A0FE|nr:DNA replication factor Dna2-domain-containing protein [Gamsiella multidivaricata]KAI7821947.1 DNA replication factor Dna2-domain-containing protein [Gamsiella multidivaricata]